MKGIKWFLLFAFIIGTASGCAFNDVYAPDYLSYTDLRSAIANAAPGSLRETGKIYIKGDFIFVNEKNKGVHVIDNADPAAPRIISFINIPGNVDIAIKDNILYADSYIDLVAIDITNPLAVVEKARITDAFPLRYNYYYYEFNYMGGDIYETPDPAKGIVIGWKLARREMVPLYTNTVPMVADYAESGSTGTGGSMACFTIVGNYLYTVDSDTLWFFDITDPAVLVKDANKKLDWGIETIFPYNNKLFIGSTTGMYIFSLADPRNPVQESQFTHATSCDPVVTQGNYAYITLRSGTSCSQGSNELKIVDITNLANPQLIMTYAMNNPHGLGVDGNALFVCDFDAGLKVYDCTEPLNINPPKARFTTATVIDVIPNNGIAIVVGPLGLYQYDYNDLDNVYLVSTLSITGAQ